MEKMTLNIAAAPLSWNGREFEAKSKAFLSLDEISIERENVKSKEEDGMIV